MDRWTTWNQDFITGPLAPYRYNLLTSQYLSISLHYEQHTNYNAFHTFNKKHWVQQLPINFVQITVTGWMLSRDGMERIFG